MKKLIILPILTLGFISAGSISQVGIGYSKGEDKSKNITTFISYGVAVGLDLRFEYSKAISKYSEFASSDVNRYGLFATYTLPLSTSSFSVTPKVGIVKNSGEFEMLDTLSKVTDSSTDFTYGLELNYDFNSKLSIFAGYTDYGHKFKKLKSIKASEIDSKNYTVGFKLGI